MKGKLIITCKKDVVFHGVSGLFGRTYMQIKTGEVKKAGSIEKKVMARFRQGAGQLNFIRSTMQKEWGDAIKENRFLMYHEIGEDSGGKIIFEFEGSKEELDRWLKIRIKDKVMLKLGVNKLFDYEVVR